MPFVLQLAAIGLAILALALVLAEHFREHVQGGAYPPSRKTHPPAPAGFLQPPPELVEDARKGA